MSTTPNTGGPTGDGYRVNLSELENSTAKIGNLVAFIEDALPQIEARVAALRSGWSGESATAYDTAHQEWTDGLQDMRDGLQRMREAAATAHTNYTAAQTANVAMLGRGAAGEGAAQ